MGGLAPLTDHLYQYDWSAAPRKIQGPDSPQVLGIYVWKTPLTVKYQRPLNHSLPSGTTHARSSHVLGTTHPWLALSLCPVHTATPSLPPVTGVQPNSALGKLRLPGPRSQAESSATSDNASWSLWVKRESVVSDRAPSPVGSWIYPLRASLRPPPGLVESQGRPPRMPHSGILITLI